MLTYLVRRSLLVIVTIAGVMTILFGLQKLAGDPTIFLLPPEATEGKLIVPKFKSLPKEWRPLRKGDAVPMPVELPPPRIRRGRREECRQQ